MKLIDIGANLTNASFRHDRDQVIANALKHGVERIIVTGTSIRGSQYALDLAKKYPDCLYATAGVHPHDSRHCDEHTIASLKKLAQHDRVVAIGECGLDYNRDFSPRPQQDQWFEEQVVLACQLNMPLFLHEREAHQRLVEILLRHQSQLPKVVIHCFTGNGDELEKYLEMGFYIGITGWICDERRGKHLCELVKKIPLDRLMLETDAPFLTPRNMYPRPKRGRNEPAFLGYVLEMVAHSLSQSPEEVAKAVAQTTEKFFEFSQPHDKKNN